MLKLSINKTGELFAELSAARALYLPVEGGGQTTFSRYTPEADVRLDVLNTARSVKDFFLPQTEDIVAFKRAGKKISIIEDRASDEPFAVFGVRACDARSLDVMDRVFLSDPVDTFYKGRRENGVVISLACSEPAETCFCGVFGIDSAEPQGDVVASIVGDTLCWEAKTPAGEKLTETVKDVFSPASAEDEAAAEAQKKTTREIMRQLPLADLKIDNWGSDELLEKFNSPIWGKLYQGCIGCGTCTYVCPTCQCYDIQDFDTGHGVKRFRCWDSCMYSDFTLMAHGNPRTSQLERFRQRFMHKLVYFPANNDGMFSCVGCGRCVAKCPISMNIAKVIRALEVRTNG
ncbi:4Fe-4S ferredoxin [Synergistales bacterium]|nr:4Fe-4S ferredoxin [Synergistales bacterium]